jgi:DedD protein
MERSMQERLIGTIVVVVLGVLLIPLWLDGPDPPGPVPRDLPDSTGVRSQTIELDAAQPRPVVPPAPAEAETTPPAAATELPPDTGSPTETGVPGPPMQAANPPAERADAALKPAAAAGWAVQVGSFTSVENARKLAADLTARGFPARVSSHDDGGTRLSRVRVGPVADRADAEALAARLERAGQSAQIVRQP